MTPATVAAEAVLARATTPRCPRPSYMKSNVYLYEILEIRVQAECSMGFVSPRTSRRLGKSRRNISEQAVIENTRQDWHHRYRGGLLIEARGIVTISELSGEPPPKVATACAVTSEIPSAKHRSASNRGNRSRCPSTIRWAESAMFSLEANLRSSYTAA